MKIGQEVGYKYQIEGHGRIIKIKKDAYGLDEYCIETPEHPNAREMKINGEWKNIIWVDEDHIWEY